MSTPPRKPPPPAGLPARRSRRKAVLALAAAAVVLLLAALSAAVRPWLALRSAPTGEAAWIWSSDSPQETVPRAFYAVRDFHLEAVPAEARLEILADEAYVVHLNGLRVGAGAYHEGSPLHLYAVAPFLTRGTNRLVVELRSTRGTGGLLLRLDRGEGTDPIVVSDDGWTMVREARPGLLEGWWPLPAADAGEPPIAESPRIWGWPPMGRWGAPVPGELRPLEPDPLGPRRLLTARERDVPDRIDDELARAGHLYDFRRPVTGYLRLVVAPGAPEPLLLFVGEEPPRPSRRQADSLVLLPPGSTVWLDSRPRTFRFVLLLGDRPVEEVEVMQIAPEAAAALAAEPTPDPERRPWLGVTPPPRLSPQEVEIRRRASRRVQQGMETPG